MSPVAASRVALRSSPSLDHALWGVLRVALFVLGWCLLLGAVALLD